MSVRYSFLSRALCHWARFETNVAVFHGLLNAHRVCSRARDRIFQNGDRGANIAPTKPGEICMCCGMDCRALNMTPETSSDASKSLRQTKPVEGVGGPQERRWCVLRHCRRQILPASESRYLPKCSYSGSSKISPDCCMVGSSMCG